MFSPQPTTSSASCGAGYDGTVTQTTTYSGASCSPSTTEDRSGCTPTTPTPSTCPGSSSTSISCGAGFSGTATQTTSYSGPSCTASTSVDRSGCQRECSTTTTQESQACGVNYTGDKTRTVTTNSCTGTTYTEWNESGCKFVSTSPCSASASASDGSWAGGTEMNGVLCPLEVDINGIPKPCFYAELVYNDANDDCRPTVEWEPAETLTAAKYSRNFKQKIANDLNKRNP
jgi:hypothetical protein